MNMTTLRLRYTQLFVIGLLAIFAYTMYQSLPGGLSQINDNLWGRKFLITSFTTLRLKLGDRVFPQVAVGKDGWLQYTGGRSLDNYQNPRKIPRKVLQKTQQKLQTLYEELNKRNITLILVLPPDKTTIYPDKVPDEIQKITSQSKLDAFTTYLQQHGPPVLVDLRPALKKGRKKQDIYYKTDTHWNAYGTFIAYTEIMKELSKKYPLLVANDIKDFQKITSEPHLHDLSQIMGANDLLEISPNLTLKNYTDNNVTKLVLNNDTIPLEISTTAKDNLPTLLMFRDSFGSGIQYFISHHFHKGIFILNTSTYPDALSLETIDVFKPNIVIIEIVERFFSAGKLDNLLDNMLSEQK